MPHADTAEGVHQRGHRNFVGGVGDFWQAISKLQFEFLVAEGLRPEHHFLDIACGSLRGGHRVIPYLEPDHYFGVDKHIELIIYGVAEELGLALFRSKRPRFFVSDRFDFGSLPEPPRFALAQSLFTHLTPDDIKLCLHNLRRATNECRFFATFGEGDSSAANPGQSGSSAHFRYTRAEMDRFGVETGWTPIYIGKWNHPRDQRMMEYRC